ncbi:phosphorylated adapter RNA export protein-like [Actinia tenebrosa]|uniref:Phosphorylated adapter RNA export protein n=1 Tax=Actinia tenebrosa TaxID=6105 RepID=A0A6P8HK33_ACTTE|nr:phosphorylated adapter RNA export protein-like [Actinia tenebrosa]
MADKTFLDEVDQIDLELDVPFNEFEDEFQQNTTNNIENLPKQSNETVKATDSAENLTKSCVVGKETFGLSNDGHLIKLGKPESTGHTELSKDVEEGEVLIQEEEMELLKDTITDDTEDSNVEDGQNISRFDENRENLKRKLDNNDAALDEEADMDIDDNLILESDEESMLQEKKCKKEDNVGNEDGKDQPMKNPRGGKKKKKKKKKVVPVHYGRIPRPIIGRLFSPLMATEHDEPEVLAGQMADRLEEEKEDLILRVLQTIGNKKAIEIFQETKKIQVEGGMSTVYGNRRRTSGGIFIYLLKSKGYATKEQLKEIFAVEREKAKQLIKEQKKRDKELREQGINDLRQKLAEKKEMLLKAEDNKSENKSVLEASKSEDL